MEYWFRCRKCNKRVPVISKMGVSPTMPGKCECGGDYGRMWFFPGVIYKSIGFDSTDKRFDPTEDE